MVIDAVRDPSGKLVGYAKITRALTERRAAKETVRKSEQPFRLLVQRVTVYALPNYVARDSEVIPAGACPGIQ